VDEKEKPWESNARVRVKREGKRRGPLRTDDVRLRDPETTSGGAKLVRRGKGDTAKKKPAEPCFKQTPQKGIPV